MAEIGEPERKVRREREDQPAPSVPRPVTIPEPVPANYNFASPLLTLISHARR